jgi:SH3 domain protein
MMISILRSTLLILVLTVPAAYGEPAWVTDEFEITLRSGPSSNNVIQLMLASGKQVEVMENDPESGYSRVSTQAGTEGWVLTRYLMNERSAREQLETLTNELINANSRGTSLGSQMTAVKGEYDAANNRIASLEREKAAAENELAEIKRTAANVLGINKQNQSLMDQLAAAQIHADSLEQENRELASQTTRYWVLSGGLLVLVGIILGIWLPRIRWQRRRSGYDRF